MSCWNAINIRNWHVEMSLLAKKGSSQQERNLKSHLFSIQSTIGHARCPESSHPPFPQIRDLCEPREWRPTTTAPWNQRSFHQSRGKIKSLLDLAARPRSLSNFSQLAAYRQLSFLQRSLLPCRAISNACHSIRPPTSLNVKIKVLMLICKSQINPSQFWGPVLLELSSSRPS